MASSNRGSVNEKGVDIGVSGVDVSWLGIASERFRLFSACFRQTRLIRGGSVAAGNGEQDQEKGDQFCEFFIILLSQTEIEKMESFLIILPRKKSIFTSDQIHLIKDDFY